MNYKVLARKWRPQDFSEIVGQEHVVVALSNALDSNKVHQAYLLSGTRGVGKTTIGRILTKGLNCEKGISSKPCNKCSACKSIKEGSFMDFQEVDAASRRGVEETQQLLETVMHVPGSSRYKVYLIDEVHMLSKHSFNALLKTLEEPPPHVVFILATTEPESVPATVMSRCLQFHLKNLTPPQLNKRLEEILTKEEVDFDQESINLISRAGRGSLRDCLTITDQAIAFCNGNLKNLRVSELLGTIPYDHVFNLIDCVINKKSEELLNQLRKITDLGVDYHRLLDLVLETIQHIAIFQISPTSLEDLNLNLELLNSLSLNVDAEEVQILYQIGLIAKRDMDLAPNIGDGFEMALLRMMSFIPKKFEDKELEGEKKENNRLANEGNKEQKSKQSNEPKKKLESRDNDSFADIINKSSWNQIFESLNLDLGTKQLISHCSFSRTENSVIYFSMPKNKLDLLNGKHREKFQNSLSLLLESECIIFFEENETDESSPIKEKEKKKEIELDKARKAIENDPKVNKILNSLGGKIVDSSIVPKERS